MKQIFSIIAVTVLFLSAGGEVAEAKKPEKPKGPYRAVIIIEGIHSREGVGNFKAISIVASKLVSQLESFFPKYRQLPSSEIAAPWKMGHRVYFQFSGGKSICVTVSKNGNGAYWTVNKGDFQTKGDFPSFVKKLQ